MSRITYFSLATALLVGCAAPDNYDSTVSGRNPFNEPKSHTPHVSIPATPGIKSNKSSSAEFFASEPIDHLIRNHEPQENTSEKVLVRALPTQGVVTSNRTDAASELEYPSATYEMLAEAKRLNQMGDFTNSSQLLRDAGYSGNPEAFYMLSKMHQDGTLPKDDSAMFGYLTLAHDMGHHEATRVLGNLYLLGMIAPKDISYGRLLMEKAAKESPRAAREYGEMLTNQRSPHLDQLDIGILYLEDSVKRGHTAAMLPLANAYEAIGKIADALVLRADAEIHDLESGVSPSHSNMQAPSPLDKALLSGPQAIYDYALQILIRKIKDPDPELTGYCLMAVAGSQGYEPALKELGHLDGIRTSKLKSNPGQIDACVEEYQARAGIQIKPSL